MVVATFEPQKKWKKKKKRKKKDNEHPIRFSIYGKLSQFFKSILSIEKHTLLSAKIGNLATSLAGSFLKGT